MMVLSGTWNSLVSKSTGGILSPGLHNESDKVCKVVWRGKETISNLRENSACKGTLVVRDPVPVPFKNALWQVLAMFVGMILNFPLHFLTSRNKSLELPKAAILGFAAPSAFSMLVIFMTLLWLFLSEEILSQASALMMASLKFLPASTYEMLRFSTHD